MGKRRGGRTRPIEKTKRKPLFPTAHHLRPPNSCHLWLSYDGLQLLPRLCISQHWSRRQRFLQSVALFLSLIIQWGIISWQCLCRCIREEAHLALHRLRPTGLWYSSQSVTCLIPPFPEVTPCRDTANPPHHLCHFTFFSNAPSLCPVSSTE